MVSRVCYHQIPKNLKKQSDWLTLVLKRFLFCPMMLVTLAFSIREYSINFFLTYRTNRSRERHDANERIAGEFLFYVCQVLPYNYEIF